MSRGLGSIQRSCLEVFRLNPGKLLDSIEITGGVVCRDEITDSEHASVRRALRKLAAAGLVVDMQRAGWRNGCRHWATPETAAEHYRKVETTFGINAVPIGQRHLLQGPQAQRNAAGDRPTMPNKGRGTIRDPELRQRLLGVLTGRWQKLTMLCGVPIAPENKTRAKAAGLGEHYLIRERLRGMEKSGLVESRKGDSGQREYRLTTKGRQARKKGR